MDVRVRPDPRSAKAASGVPLPNLPAPAHAVAADGRSLGRNAILLHMLAYVFFLGAWGMMLFLGELTQESEAIQGVGAAAAIAFSLWSLVISIRALIRAECPLLPVLNIAWVMIEIAVPCVAVWIPLLIFYRVNSNAMNALVYFGVPVFVPFLLLGSFAVVPVAWLVVRWRMHACQRAGKDMSTRAQRWKFGAIIYVTLMLGLGTLTLCPALYVCSVLANRIGVENPLTRGAVLYTPDSAKEFMYGLACWTNCEDYRRAIIFHGKPRDAYLEYLASHNDRIAWLEVEMRGLQFDLSRKISANPAEYSAETQFNAGVALGSIVDGSDLTRLLSNRSDAPGAFEAGLFTGSSSNLMCSKALTQLLDSKSVFYQRHSAVALSSYRQNLKLTPSVGLVFTKLWEIDSRDFLPLSNTEKDVLDEMKKLAKERGY